MSKTYKGWELMKAISDGEIKNGSRFNVHRTYSSIAVLEDRILHFEDGNKRELTTNDLKIYTFELIENEIDIDNIKELYINDKTKSVGKDAIENWTGRSLDITFSNKINEILQAVKQIDKRVKKLEEK